MCLSKKTRHSPATQPVDARYGGEVGGELEAGGDHEGEVELEVEVGDVPHGGVEHTADHHEENDGEQTNPSHCGIFKQIQVGVVRPEGLI